MTYRCHVQYNNNYYCYMYYCYYHYYIWIPERHAMWLRQHSKSRNATESFPNERTVRRLMYIRLNPGVPGHFSYGTYSCLHILHTRRLQAQQNQGSANVREQFESRFISRPIKLYHPGRSFEGPWSNTGDTKHEVCRDKRGWFISFSLTTRFWSSRYME